MEIIMKIQNIAFASAVLMTLAVGASMPSSAQTAAAAAPAGDSKNCPNGDQTYDVKTGTCLDTIHPGMALDWTIVGGTKESHMNYNKSLTAEDRDYITSVCKISYKHRTAQEKAYCADIM
jgi:hypothetical protein